MILCINNNAIIKNNYGRLQDHILLLKIPVGIRKSLFEIYWQFGHAPSKMLASPALHFCGPNVAVEWKSRSRVQVSATRPFILTGVLFGFLKTL